MADWMEPFARTIDEYVVSSTLNRVDWNAELVRGDLGKAVQQLKRESGKVLFMRGVKGIPGTPYLSPACPGLGRTSDTQDGERTRRRSVPQRLLLVDEELGGFSE